MDYTGSQTGPLVVQSEEVYATDENIARASNVAEKRYREEFGPRSILIHVVSRFDVRQTPGWAISPKRWHYVVRYPDNVHVFASVCLQTMEFLSWGGWSSHREILADAAPGRDKGTWIVAPRHPMSTFNIGLAGAR